MKLKKKKRANKGRRMSRKDTGCDCHYCIVGRNQRARFKDKATLALDS